MRLRACLGIVLLASGGCAHIPEIIRLEIDGSTVEIKKKPGEPANDNEAENSERDDAGGQ